MNSVEQISLWDFIFSGIPFTNIILISILFLGIIMLYLFFLKYFYLKEILNQDSDFLANVADCIYDHRIEAAKDWCKRVISPESRIIKKGLDKIEKSSFEMLIAVSNQREIEVLKMRKNLFRFGLLSKIIVFLGTFGTGFSLILFFVSREQNTYSAAFYTSFLPISIGALLGMILYLFKMILVSLIYHIEVDLKMKGNKFLEIVAESK